MGSKQTSTNGKLKCIFSVSAREGRSPARKQRYTLFHDSVKESGNISSLRLFAQGNKSNIINRWILQQLSMSSLTALHPFTTFSGVLCIVNQE